MAKKTAKNPKGAGRKKLIIDYERLKEIGGKGLSEEQIAQVLGISWHTLSRRKKDSANFERAIQEAKSQSLLEVSNALFKNATEKNNIQAQMFYLRNRSDNWKADEVIEHKISLKDVLTNAKQRIIDIKGPETLALTGGASVPNKNKGGK
jgi:hypothetical protein